MNKILSVKSTYQKQYKFTARVMYLLFTHRRIAPVTTQSIVLGMIHLV